MSLNNLGKLIKQVSEVQPPAQEFGQLLLKTIQETKHSSRKPSKTFKPSSIGGCMRKIYFEVKGEPVEEERMSAELQGICEVGTYRHDELQKSIMLMQEQGYDCEWIDVGEFLSTRGVDGTVVRERMGNETKLYNSIFNMSFMCDGIIKFKGIYYILEIKTETNFKWMARLAPEPMHCKQASTYSLCIGIDKVLFLYENRDTLGKKFYEYAVTDEDKQGIVDIVETVNTHIEDDTIPEKTDTKKHCNYCNYKKLCRAV